MSDKLKKDGTKVWLDDVPDDGIGSGWDRYVRALHSALRYLGEAVDAERLLALSGEAFQICFASNWQGNGLTCVATDPAMNMARACGYKGRWVNNGYSSELVDLLDPAERQCLTAGRLEDIFKEIDRGRPVLAQGVTGAGGTAASLVVGYDREETLLCHQGFAEPQYWSAVSGINLMGSQSSGAGYWNGQVRGTVRPGFAGGWLANPAFLLGHKSATPEARQQVTDALDRIVQMHYADPLDISWWGGVRYWFGRQAFEQWALALEQLDYPNVLSTPRPADAYDWFNFRLLHAFADWLATGRTAAAGFCRHAAAVLPEAAHQLESAADLYAQEAQMAAEEFAIFLEPFQLDDPAREGWLADPGSRGRGAAVVRRLEDKETMAVDYISQALDLLAGIRREENRVWIADVPPIAAGSGAECGFAAALEAALAATEHPVSYGDIMAYSGLAFQVPWFRGSGDERWSPSGAVGERASSHKPLQHATGWQLRPVMRRGWPDMSEFIPLLVESIDSGHPVPAFTDQSNMAVMIGYVGGGEALLFRDPEHPEEPYTLPADNLGWLLYLIEDHQDAMPPKAAMITTLRLILQNWYAPTEISSAGHYFHGEQAIRAWLEDLRRLDEYSDTDQRQLFFVNWFAFRALADAHGHGPGFLRRNAELPGEETAVKLRQAANAFDDAAALLQQPFHDEDAFLGSWTPKSYDDWSPTVRRREQDLLTAFLDLEQIAIERLEEVLADLRDPAVKAEDLKRLEQWSNLFGNHESCIKAADREPVFYDLLKQELKLGGLPDSVRDLRQRMSRLEPAETAYGDQVDSLLSSLAAGRLVNPWPTSQTSNHKLRVKRTAETLKLWLQNTTHLDAKRDRRTGEAAVDFVYGLLGDCDDDKVTAVSMIVDKLETGDLRDADKQLELAPNPQRLEELFAHQISMLDPDCWTFDHNLKILLKGIGNKRVEALWGDPDGPIPWGGIRALNPRLKPKLLSAIESLHAWLDDGVDIDGRFGEPDPYPAADWLARCLLVYLEHHVSGRF